MSNRKIQIDSRGKKNSDFAHKCKNKDKLKKSDIESMIDNADSVQDIKYILKIMINK